MKKCREIEFWHAFPIFKQKLSISDSSVKNVIFVCVENNLISKSLFVSCVLNEVHI